MNDLTGVSAGPNVVAAVSLTRLPGRHARRDAAVRSGSGVFLGLGVLLVTAWWAQDGGFQDLGGWESGLISVGRVTGLIASELLLVQVLLMARLPPLERAFGQDRLARLHRTVGFTSFVLMLAHLVLITWGYAAGELTRTPETLWDLVIHYPGMLLATAGTGCLFLVVVTSLRAARRKLRYESWHLLHLYAYLGVGLAIPHQLWTGQSFLNSSAATVYWWALWAAAVAAVISCWLVSPIWRSARHRIEVTAVVREDHDVVSVYMTGRHLERLRVQPGQFLMWRFVGRPGWSRANPYSLSASPNGSVLRITAKTVGDGSMQLADLRVGTRVVVEGPYGRLTSRPRTKHRLAFIGAGVGITPLRALAEGMPYAPGDAIVVQRFQRQPLFESEFVRLADERGLQVVALRGGRRTDSSWLSSDAGDVDDVAALRSWIPDIAERDVYVCGPKDWTEAVCRAAGAVGVPARQLHVENFGW